MKKQGIVIVLAIIIGQTQAMNFNNNRLVSEVGSVMPSKPEHEDRSQISFHQDGQDAQTYYTLWCKHNKAHKDLINTIAVSPDTKKIAVGFRSGLIQFHHDDNQLWAPYHTLENYSRTQMPENLRKEEPIITMAFSSNPKKDQTEEKLAFVQEWPHHSPRFNAFVYYIHYKGLVRLNGYTLAPDLSFNPWQWKDYGLSALGLASCVQTVLQASVCNPVNPDPNRPCSAQQVMAPLISLASVIALAWSRFSSVVIKGKKHRGLGWKDQYTVVTDGAEAQSWDLSNFYTVKTCQKKQ